MKTPVLRTGITYPVLVQVRILNAVKVGFSLTRVVVRSNVHRQASSKYLVVVRHILVP